MSQTTLAAQILVGVEQTGIAIFGMGRNREEAIDDAREWVDDDVHVDGLQFSPRAAHGEMRLVNVTHALTVAVCAAGGSVAYASLRDGTLCTIAEAEAAREEIAA